MKIIPAIEIKGKRCAGFGGSGAFIANPKRVVERLAGEGAGLIHLIDLEGEKVGRLVNFDILDNLSYVASLQIEGGMRGAGELRKVLGIDARAAVPVTALRDGKVREVAIGNRKMVSIVARAEEESEVGMVRENEKACSAVIVRFRGNADLGLVGKLAREVSVPVIAFPEKVSYEELKGLKKAGAYACIIGKQLFSGEMELGKAIKEAK